MAAFEAFLVFLILVVNVVGELQRKRTLATSRGFLATARLSCFFCLCILRTASWPYRWTDYDARWLIGRVSRQGSAFWES